MMLNRKNIITDLAGRIDLFSFVLMAMAETMVKKDRDLFFQI